MAISSKLLNYAAVGASYGFVFGLLGTLLMFLFSVFVARGLGPELFGLYSLGDTIIKILLVVLSLGIPEAIPKFLPTFLKQKSSDLTLGYMYFIKRFLVIVCLLGSISIFFLSGSIASFFNGGSELESVIKIIAFIVPLKVLTTVLKKLFIATKNFKYREVSYHLIERGLILVIGLIVLFFNLSIQNLFIGLLVVQIISFVYLVYHSRRKIRISKNKLPKFEVSHWILFSVPLFFNNIFGFFISWSDNVIIAKMLPLESLGLYSVGFSIAYQLLFFQSIFRTSFLPLMSEAKAGKDKSETRLLFTKISSWIFGLSLPLFLLVLLFSKELLFIFFGSAYVGVSLPLIILSTGMVLSTLFGLSSNITVINNKTWINFSVNLFTAVLNIILNIALIPLFGLAGAALSTAFSIFFSSFIFFMIGRSIEKIQLDFKFLTKFLLVGAISASLTFFIKNLGDSLILLLVSLALFCSLFVIGLYVIKPFGSDDKQIVLFFEKVSGIKLGPIRRFMRI